MGLLDFVKEAGELLFGGKEAKAEEKENTEKALTARIENLGLEVQDLKVDYEEGTVIVHGKVSSQAEREKVILAVGNIKGVEKVHDYIEVEEDTPEGKFYTVKKGDTLWAIAKENYGDGNKYMVIFEANKPMLSDPDKIYPDQVLRIPELDG